MTDTDKQMFRQALGAFATGVTIVTTCDNDGIPVGVTASSFNSVSLDPPLVLWSLAKSSRSHDAFCASGHFAIHILASDQDDLSNRFARSGADKFDGVAWRRGDLGSPVLDRFATLFECRTKYRYEGGDHVILVGEVIDFETSENAPLVFHAGRYAEARERAADIPVHKGVDLEGGAFTDDFLLYLVSRAHFQSSAPTRRKLAALGLSQIEYLVLARLSMESPLANTELTAQLEHTGTRLSDDALEAMVVRGLLARSAAGLEPAEAGRSAFLETLAVAKAFEEDLVERFSPGELSDAKCFLRKLIDLTGTDVPIAWR